MRQRLLLILFVALSLALLFCHKLATAEALNSLAPSQSSASEFNHSPQTNQGGIAEIQGIVRGLDLYSKRNERAGRYFADVSNYESNEPAKWREFRTRKALDKAWETGGTYTSANVWSKPTGEMIAVFTFSSPSGDWVQYMTNYYRADGTLAKSSAELRTFMGDIIRIQDRLYDANGKLIKEQKRYLDLKTKRPKRGKPDFMEIEAPLYTKASALPFYSLWKKR